MRATRAVSINSVGRCATAAPSGAHLSAAVLSLTEILADALRLGRLHRQADPQHRVARLRFDTDRAAVALDDDAPRDVETEPGALAHVLGRVERLERAGQYLRRHARTGVADL